LDNNNNNNNNNSNNNIVIIYFLLNTKSECACVFVCVREKDIGVDLCP